jgi:hypothetical protein
MACWLFVIEYRLHMALPLARSPRSTVTPGGLGREPPPIRVIAVRMLAATGIALPNSEVRKRLRIAFAAMDRRGVTVRVGEKGASKRSLVAWHSIA